MNHFKFTVKLCNFKYKQPFKESVWTIIASDENEVFDYFPHKHAYDVIIVDKCEILLPYVVEFKYQ